MKKIAKESLPKISVKNSQFCSCWLILQSILQMQNTSNVKDYNCRLVNAKFTQKTVITLTLTSPQSNLRKARHSSAH